MARHGLAFCGFVGLFLVASPAGAEDNKATDAICPRDSVIQLFNGRDLTGLYTWLVDTKYEDPRQVFSVQDGMLHVSGDGLGYICTKQPYRDYRLLAEFKWGPRTWGSRKKAAKDSGILIHCTEPDGSAGSWMASIEAQIIEGGVGDLLVVAGKKPDGSPIDLSLTCEVTKDRDGEAVWKRGAPRQKFTSGRINWYGRDPDWKDELGFRGREDVESPDGQWTRMEVVCDGGHILVMVNGIVVNEGFDSVPTEGKILVQTEFAEMFVRKLELHPLKERAAAAK